MNYKLEKFWNLILGNINSCVSLWTINLKSFEICMAGVSKGLTLDEL